MTERNSVLMEAAQYDAAAVDIERALTLDPDYVEIAVGHDRSRFDVIGVSIAAPTTAPRCARLQGAFDRFIDCADLTDDTAGDRVREEEVDILVDLNGLTIHARTGIFARRPAPIQVNTATLRRSPSAPGASGGLLPNVAEITQFEDRLFDPSSPRAVFRFFHRR